MEKTGILLKCMVVRKLRLKMNSLEALYMRPSGASDQFIFFLQYREKLLLMLDFF